METPLPWLIAGTVAGLAIALAGRTVGRRLLAARRRSRTSAGATSMLYTSSQLRESTAFPTHFDALTLPPTTMVPTTLVPPSTLLPPLPPSRPGRSNRPRSKDPARAAAREKAAQVIAAEAARVQAQRAAAAPAPKPHVLVVDDSTTIRQKTGAMLERHGYRATYAVDGIEALMRIASERPDAVVTDIEMPRLDGVDLVRRLRGDPRTAALPIVVVSSEEARYRDAVLAEGVQALLAKPYPDDALLAPLAGLHAQARARQRTTVSN